MTQAIINSYFNTQLGQQLSELYTTSDDRIFIRHEEAEQHALGQLYPDTEPLDNKTITEWYPEY